MKEKKNILMICSWLDLELKIGSFFWEQAAFMNNDFNFILCNFKRKNIGVKSILKFLKNWRIESHQAPNKVKIYYINYPFISHFSEKTNLLFYKYSIKIFYKHLNKINKNISLIHAQSIFNAGFEAFYLNEISNVPYIFTEHSQISLRNKTHYETQLLSQVLNNASKKLVVSYDKIRQFAANNLFANFEVIGNGIDSSLFNYKVKKNIDNVDVVFKIVTIGAFNPIKDQLTILKALKIIDGKTKIKIRFTWGGYNCWGSDADSKVNNLISMFKFKNIEIQLLPLLSRIEVASILSDSDLFLFSSISEGMPVSVLEALASGLPVCSTRCGGVDEFINKTNGKIIQIKDHNKMADFTIKVINKEIEFNNENISIKILNEYGNHAFSERLKEIYLKAIKNI
jgi:glycosyltransferase involved in cell wall biosynthesis